MEKNLAVDPLFNEPILNLAFDTLKQNKQALVFVNTKRSAEKAALEIAKKIKGTNKELDTLGEKVLAVLSRPTKQCEALAQCVKKGIAFHHAGLTQKQRELIEDNFRANKVRIICCTPTLAAGVDLPAFRAIIKDLKRYGGFEGMSFIPVLEFQQMAGRCGRPTFDSWGEAICIAGTDKEREAIIERYFEGEPEDLYSKLAVEPVFRTYLLSLIAAGFVRSKKDMLEFFSKTFWAHQFQDMEKLEQLMMKMLYLLEEWEFVRLESKKNEFVSADALEGGGVKATLLGERVAQLYIDPLTAFEMITALRKAPQQLVNHFSFLQLISSCLEMRPLLKAKVKEQDRIQEKLAEVLDVLLKSEPSLYDPEYEDFLHSIKTALLFEEWANERDEEWLLENFDIRPGEIRTKLDKADWLLYAAEELAKLMQLHPLVKEIVKLRFRLRYGVKEELLPLLKLEQVGRVRARKLYNNRIRDIKDVKEADVSTLAALLGKEIALTVKAQVGQKIDGNAVNIKKTGQINLTDY